MLYEIFERKFIINYLSNVRKDDRSIFDKITNLITNLSNMESIGEISYECCGPRFIVFILDRDALNKFKNVVSQYESSVLN